MSGLSRLCEDEGIGKGESGILLAEIFRCCVFGEG